MNRGDDGEEDEDRKALAVHRTLRDRGVLAEVELGGLQESSWLDCDLASLAENRLGEIVDPLAIGDALREGWLARATTERPWPPSRRLELERCYWLLHDGARAGTVALATKTLGGANLRVASLYVLPAFRGRGVGTRALRELVDALGAAGLGLRLSTSWTWQRTVRFYVRLGMWVRMWKRDLDLRWRAGEPSPRFELEGDRARLLVELDGRRHLLASARREGDRLVLDERPEVGDARLDELGWDAGSTFSLLLALHGWPLVRSDEDWERCRASDAVTPEALAYKITIWEAWDRAHGFRVDTPRIPGLHYPTWDELEARWRASEAELGLGLGELADRDSARREP